MEAIPKLLNEDDNFFLDVVPTAIEIKEAVFSMNAKSAPGPDGFPGCFYRFAWSVIGVDLIEAIPYCWSHRFIPKGFNSNFIFLLPKIQGARRAEQFRPIGIANFIFKIFTRILTTRISCLIGRLMSPQKVLRRFGFSEVSINWIRKIFESAMISVLVNGGPCGSFGVGRGLRQGDPLSPILFILAEEVLRRNISNLIQEGKIQAMVTRGGISDTRRNGIADYLQMGLSELRDTYLGVILFPGRVKTYQVWGMLELMQKMLAGWIAFQFTIVYKWPKNVILECERIVRNFLWSGDPAVKKLITVKWDEVNAPTTEGGLGLSRLEVMNKSLLMKLLWKIETEDVEWTNLLRSKYKNKNNEWTTTYKQSSI
ncbi:uncharacterized protein LOC113360499 [Papaver somniferum]|uniref:uncharacterized protein LOC113360499 n=1 Tax=Papaver somniferum TaxID=3469 RepID=UPI000E702F71|nr:uncharacterized protein LOC113360499 [Papaver somniferum]